MRLPTRRQGLSRTRRLLERHLLLALVTGLVALTALYVSYREVQNAAGEMRTRGAPAVQGVAATQLALLRAQAEARSSHVLGIDEVIGAGARYESQLAAADQGLSRLSDIQLDGERGRGVLETVNNGLLTSYNSSITPAAVTYVHDDAMQALKFSEAQTILTRPDTGVVPRLDVLQEHQMRHVALTSSLGPLQSAGWAVAELALLALALICLSALWVLRTRCGRSLDPFLLAGFLLAVALAVVPLWVTVQTQQRLDEARHGLTAIEQRAGKAKDRVRATDPLTRDAKELARDITALARDQRYVTDRSNTLRVRLAARDRQSVTYYGALGGSALLVLLPAAGICRRLAADYWRAG
ncbi:hypothetical protein [Streptomyces sp. NPDC001478]